MGRTLYRCALDDRPHEPKPTCVRLEVAGFMHDHWFPVTHELVAEWLEPERAHVIGATFETCQVCVADRRPSHS